jgi:hypothetical protein
LVADGQGRTVVRDKTRDVPRVDMNPVTRSGNTFAFIALPPVHATISKTSPKLVQQGLGTRDSGVGGPYTTARVQIWSRRMDAQGKIMKQVSEHLNRRQEYRSSRMCC